jgi:hypothetical protein
LQRDISLSTTEVIFTDFILKAWEEYVIVSVV